MLRCPKCASALELDGGARCGAGHAFDIARQGYLSLLTGRGVGTGDTAAMVAARAETLGSGLLDPVTAAVVRAAGRTDGLVLDLAGGTGHHLAAVLDSNPDALGLCLDASAPALRRAARAHPRAAAVGADAWGTLPLADSSVSCALSVFGPRNADELRRVIRSDGRIMVVAPSVDHLRELVVPLGLVRVDPRKAERQARTFAEFTVTDRVELRYRADLDHEAVSALVGMGPSGAHLDVDTIAARVHDLPDALGATVSVVVTTYAVPC